ncbi:histidine kinase [Cellulomonas triticagri]|uniref:histidine kinase n=1 Tax=Cellulomonas triticagri TaxID=2483352 RepID=UPI0013152427|nr:histidine kinase [Cellulomonas triticagri]
MADPTDPRPDDEPTPDAPDAPKAAPAPASVPDEDELARVAEPARVRRAPKVGAFIGAGTVLGIVVGLVLALVTSAGSDVQADGTAFISVLEGQGSVRFLSALAGGVVGALAGAGAALLADRRSLRGRKGDARP